MQQTGVDSTDIEQRLQQCSSNEQLQEYVRQLHAELAAERAMHQQARTAMTDLHASTATVEQRLLECQAKLSNAMEGRSKKRRFLRTNMDPVVVVEHHLLQEKLKALEATELKLREEIVALKCQKDGNSQATYATVEKLQRALEENAELGRQSHEMRAMHMEHSKVVQDLHMQLGEAQSWAAQLEREREALAAKCYTLEQELNHYKRRG